MKIIAVVFSHSPHGTSFGREGLDAILSISSVFKRIKLFFFGDGVFQLFKSYYPDKILSRDYIPAFSILSLYDITGFFCCEFSLIQRGLNYRSDFIFKIDILNSHFLRLELDKCDVIINF